MNLEIERQIVNAFVIKNKRERSIWELGNPQKRGLFAADLSDKLDRVYFRKLRNGENVYQVLKELGAPDSCYIISRFEENDGKTIDLKHGLKILDYEFELMSCIPDKLAFFRETPTDCYILIK